MCERSTRGFSQPPPDPCGIGPQPLARNWLTKFVILFEIEDTAWIEVTCLPETSDYVTWQLFVRVPNLNEHFLEKQDPLGAHTSKPVLRDLLLQFHFVVVQFLGAIFPPSQHLLNLGGFLWRPRSQVEHRQQTAIKDDRWVVVGVLRLKSLFSKLLLAPIMPKLVIRTAPACFASVRRSRLPPLVLERLQQSHGVCFINDSPKHDFLIKPLKSARSASRVELMELGLRIPRRTQGQIVSEIWKTASQRLRRRWPFAYVDSSCSSVITEQDRVAAIFPDF